MSTAIEVIDIGGIDDSRFVIGNAQIAAVLDRGNDWTRIRLGFRFAWDSTGANLTGTPLFYAGVLASPSAGMANGPLTTSTSHFVGTIPRHSTWTYNAGPPERYAASSFTGYTAIKRIGSTNTTGTNTSTGTTNYSATPSANRTAHFVEITKGSPNFSIQVCGNSGTTVPDISLIQLRQAMEIDNLNDAAAVLGYSGPGATAGAVAVDEGTDGNLNAVCFAWDRATPVVRLSDFLVSFFA